MEVAKILFLICYVGGPGNARQAGPVVERFLRHVESTVGWSKGKAEGAFHTSLERCQATFKEKKPQLVVTDLPTYLSQREKWQLAPVAHMGRADKKRYYLLVRKGSFASLAALKGKTVQATLAAQPQFLSKIVFGGKVDASKHFKLTPARRPLSGIRAVSRGKADATVVDELAYAHLKELPLAKPLVSIFRSAAVPGLTLATTGNRLDKKLRASVLKSLPKLCTGPGKQLCRTFQVDGMVAADRKIYRKLQKQYAGK